MKYKRYVIAAAAGLVLSAVTLYGQDKAGPSRYRDYAAVEAAARLLRDSHPGMVVLHTIATSPGGKALTLLEIGKKEAQLPAIFVAANLEGKTPLSTEGALYLASMVLDSSQYTRHVRWYILPLANPDAAAGFFSGVRYERTVNDREVNNDVDDQVNEDGPDDLNGDGMITLMRVEDPSGTHLLSGKDPRILVRADASKGERGKYKLYPEGLDNDGDGQYNEDGPGGINIGISFPHLFRPNNKESGLWPGESPETLGIMEFMFGHPEIVMAFTLGTSDFCVAPPRGGRTGGANLESIKVPARYASRFGLDPEKTYSMDEIMELFRSMMPAGTGREVTPEMVAGFLGLGAAVNPLEEDLKVYTTFSENYKEYLKKQGATRERMAADPDKDGSFELWAYYHLGLPSFAMNLFTLPKPKEEKPAASSLTPEEAGRMSTEEFLALGEEKIAAFLAAQKVPERMGASRVMEMLKSGRVTPGQMVAMMKNIPQPPKSGELDEKEKALLARVDAHPEMGGFASWQPYEHPTLGKVEIGGFAPYLTTTPPAGQIDSLCRLQIPWLLQLSAKIPSIRFLKEKLTPLGAGIYRLELFIENAGTLPYPIAMGARNRQPAPVVVLLEGENVELLEGFKRTPLGDIGGNQVKKLSWILKTEGKTELRASLESAPFGTSSKQIKIGN